MAYISKTGISNTSTIQAEHITRIIDALDGTAATEVSASGQFDGSHSGSFSGSFVGDGSNITGVTGEWDGTHNGNAQITGSLIVTSTVSASNLSGTNTGDQDLSSYAQTANVVANSATASLVNNSATSSFVNNSQTASFAITGSSVLFVDVTASGNISGSNTISGNRLSADTYVMTPQIQSTTTQLLINDHVRVAGAVTASLGVYSVGPITASADISCSHAHSIITATTGTFNHIITDGETMEFRSAATRNVVGSLKFDAVRGLDVKDGNGNEGKMRAKSIDIPSGGSLIVSASQVDFTGLPSADPRAAGRMWNDRGTVKISTGD
tara:strand:- start:34922 stop:35896 length:975 start_codon:yes stop_codon:yes gene_type:complete